MELMPAPRMARAFGMWCRARREGAESAEHAFNLRASLARFVPQLFSTKRDKLSESGWNACYASIHVYIARAKDGEGDIFDFIILLGKLVSSYTFLFGYFVFDVFIFKSLSLPLFYFGKLVSLITFLFGYLLFGQVG